MNAIASSGVEHKAFLQKYVKTNFLSIVLAI